MTNTLARNAFRKVEYAEAEPRPAMKDGAAYGNPWSPFPATEGLKGRSGFLLRRDAASTGSATDVASSVALDDGDGRTIITAVEKRGHDKPKISFSRSRSFVALLLEIQKTQNNWLDGFVFLNTRNTPPVAADVGQPSSPAKKQRRHCHIGIAPSGSAVRAANGRSPARPPVELVSLALGHSSSAITEKYYVQVSHETEAIRARPELRMPENIQLDLDKGYSRRRGSCRRSRQRHSGNPRWRSFAGGGNLRRQAFERGGPLPHAAHGRQG